MRDIHLGAARSSLNLNTEGEIGSRGHHDDVQLRISGSSLFPSFLSREDHDPEPAPTIQGAAWGLISASMEAPSCSAPAFLCS